MPPSLMVKIQNTDNPEPAPSKQDDNAISVAEIEEDYPVMDNEEAINYITKLVEKAAGEGNSEPISITIKNTQGIVEKYTLIPSQSDDSQELDYVLVVTQPQKEFKGDNLKSCLNGSTKVIENDKPSNEFDKSVNVPLEDKEELNSVISLESKYVAKLKEIKPEKEKTSVKTPSTNPNQASTNVVLTCSDCNYVTKSKCNLKRHMSRHLVEKAFKCEICDKSFKTSRLLNFHMNGHRGIKPYKCSECPVAFCSPGEVIRHRMYKHSKNKRHECPDCNYTCIEYSKLRRHVQAHVGYRPFACPHCTFRSVDNFKLKRHLRIHTGEKPYKCGVCKRAFNQSNTLKLHMRIHEDRKPQFKCHLCPAMLTRKTDLRVHFMSQHSNDKPLICKKCGKFFPDRYAYRIHNRTHQGEKCFKCELCSFASLTRAALQSHMYIHTDEKPFKCPFCNKAFRQKYQIPVHVKSQHELATADLLQKIGVKVEFCEEDLRALTFKRTSGRHNVKPVDNKVLNRPGPVSVNRPAHMLEHSYSSSGPIRKPYVLLESIEKTLLNKAFLSGNGIIQDGPQKLDLIKCEATSPGQGNLSATNDPNISGKYPCLYCLKYYKTKLTLRRHYKNYHGVDKPHFTNEIRSRMTIMEEVPGITMYDNANTMSITEFVPQEDALKTFVKEMQEDLKIQNVNTEDSPQTGQNQFLAMEELPQIVSPKSRDTSNSKMNLRKRKNGEDDSSNSSPNQSDASIFFGNFSTSCLTSSPQSKDHLEATLLNAFTDWDSMKVCKHATRKCV